jgi:hypothetical protein
MAWFVYTGRHADSLADGRPVEPGEKVSLSKEATADNKTRIDEGLLVETKPLSTLEGKKGDGS